MIEGTICVSWRVGCAMFASCQSTARGKVGAHRVACAGVTPSGAGREERASGKAAGGGGFFRDHFLLAPPYLGGGGGRGCHGIFVAPDVGLGARDEVPWRCLCGGACATLASCPQRRLTPEPPACGGPTRPGAPALAETVPMVPTPSFP